MVNTYHCDSTRPIVNLVKKLGVMAAGLGVSGAIGAVSAILLLYVLIDALRVGTDDTILMYLCAVFGVIIGGVCFKIVLWAGKSKSALP